MTCEERNEIVCICGGEVVVLQAPVIELVADNLTHCRRREAVATTIFCQKCNRVVIDSAESRAVRKWKEGRQES